MHDRTGLNGSGASLRRTTVLLEAVAAADHPLGVSDLARQTGIPKTSVHRLLAQLVDAGLVAPAEGGVVVGPSLRGVADAMHRRDETDLRHLMVPYLVELHVRTGDGVMLGVLDERDDVVVVLESIFRQTPAAPPAERIPVGDSVMGLVLREHGRRPGAQRPRTPVLRTCGSHLFPGMTETATPVVGEGVIAVLGRVSPRRGPDAAAAEVHQHVASAAGRALRRSRAGLPQRW